MISISDISIVIVLYQELPPAYIYEEFGVNYILVDNTPGRSLKLDIPNVYYIPLNENYGIAKALNAGFTLAKKLGFSWVLTMDQDSLLSQNMLTGYTKFINNSHLKIGIVCPLLQVYRDEKVLRQDSYVQVDEALTSGSLINMEAYDESGGFLEKLFIDEVDFEFCWHIRSLGYHIYQLNNVVMQHQLGETKEYTFFGRHLFYVMNEKPVRHYYMQRNQLYVRNKYANFYPEIKPTFWGIFMCLVKIVLFEQNVLKKLKARYLGYRDFKNNIFGKCKYKELL